jgi:hypothetical protein
MRAKPLAACQPTASNPNPSRCASVSSIASSKARHPLFDRGHDAAPPLAVVAQGVLRKRLAQALEHAVVVDDDADSPCPDIGGWRERWPASGVGLHRLVDVERRQALHVEAGQPHGADDGDAEGMLRVLEGDSTAPLAVRRLEARFMTRPVRDDVDAPLLEVRDLVLSLADDDLDDGARPSSARSEPPAWPRRRDRSRNVGSAAAQAP